MVRALSSDHMLSAILFHCECNGNFMERKYKMMLLAWVGPIKLKLTQLNSQMNCIAMHKCTKSQKLGNVKEAFISQVLLYILRAQI